MYDNNTYPQPPVDRSVKVPHLVFGLLFLGVAGIWALGASDAISGESLAVLGPGVLIVAGVIGLAASLANARNRGRTAAQQPESYESYETREVDDTYDGEPAAADETARPGDTATYPTQTTDRVADGDEPTEEIR